MVRPSAIGRQPRPLDLRTLPVSTPQIGPTRALCAIKKNTNKNNISPNSGIPPLSSFLLRGPFLLRGLRNECTFSRGEHPHHPIHTYQNQDSGTPSVRMEASTAAPQSTSALSTGETRVSSAAPEIPESGKFWHWWS